MESDQHLDRKRKQLGTGLIVLATCAILGHPMPPVCTNEMMMASSSKPPRGKADATIIGALETLFGRRGVILPLYGTRTNSSRVQPCADKEARRRPAMIDDP